MNESCHYCGRSDIPMTRDHVVPRRSGGRTVQWNIVLACKPCNHAKDSRMPTCECEFCYMAVLRWKVEVQIRRESARLRRLARRSTSPPSKGVLLACLSPAMQDRGEAS